MKRSQHFSMLKTLNHNLKDKSSSRSEADYSLTLKTTRDALDPGLQQAVLP